MHLLHIQTTLFLLCDRFSQRSWNNAVDAHFSYEKTGHAHESSSMFEYYLSFDSIPRQMLISSTPFLLSQDIISTDTTDIVV